MEKLVVAGSLQSGQHVVLSVSSQANADSRLHENLVL